MSEGKGGGHSELAALKAAIIAGLDVEQFYLKYLPQGTKLQFNSAGWCKHVSCPIHNDTGKPNLSINRNSSGFKCFACGKAGNAFDFLCWVTGREPKVNFNEVLVELANLANININDWKSSDAAKAATAPVDSTSEHGQKSFISKVNKAQAKDSSTPPIASKIVTKFHNALQPPHYKYLKLKRGWNAPTVEMFSVGWAEEQKYKDRDGKWQKGKYILPVNDKDSLCRNLRRYAPDAPSDLKMINTKDYGSPIRLWPLDKLIEANPEHLIYCEGEWDCGLLIQHLIDNSLSPSWYACTNTGGCNSFEPEWLEYFYGRHVYFVFDMDAAGKTWASSIATTHFTSLLSSGKIKSLKIVHLPLDGTKDANDLTDYFVKFGGTMEDLLRIIQATPSAITGGVENSEVTIEAKPVDNFIDCIKDREFIDTRVRVPLTISGQSTKLYHATRSMRVIKCPLMSSDNCCSANAGLQIIPYGDPIFIESCMANRKALTSALQNVACTMSKPCTIEEVEKVVMEEYYAHQVIKRLTVKDDGAGHLINSQQLVTAPVYILQPEKRIDIGPHDYLATGYVRSHPVTRAATMFIEHMEPVDEDWRSFEVNKETIPHLEAIKNYGGVKKILNDITMSVTQIYESDDILLTVLLTYLSPLSISFNGTIMRGWLNTCILGDSGTGKSKTYTRIADWINLGDMFSALSGSRTGLLYSIKQKGVEWYVEIGRYVMASGKIIAIDETQETPAEEIKKMAWAMEEGWLEVCQVASGGYQTQTRTIFIMNPKGGKKISDFAYGCQAMAECFDPMFIRRIDLAVFTTGREDHEFYNKKFDKAATDITLTAEIFRSLVHWAWTRTVNDIKWTDEATDECLKKSSEMSAIYGQADEIPLINPQDFRNNLARVSTSFAILSGSFTDDYEGVIVTADHVRKVAKFFDVVYSSPACNLKQHSKNSGKKKQLRDFDAILGTFNKVINLAKESVDRRWSEGQHFLQMVKMLQQQQYIRKRDLMEQLGVGMQWVQKHIAILAMHNLVEAHRGGYKITRKFNLFIQRWSQDKEVEAVLDDIETKIGKLAMLNPLESDRGIGYDPSMFSDDDPFHGDWRGNGP